MIDLLEDLNPQQAEAVSAPPGPVLVLAGPGAGKTRVITRRVAWLVQNGQAPRHILAVTFTNKAAGEMRARIENWLGDQMRGLTVGTFHSICARLLRRDGERLGYANDFVIYDSSDQQALIREVMAAEKIDEKRYRPAMLHGTIGKAKNELITPEAFSSDSYYAEVAGRVYHGYQAALRRNNALDFDDLLMQVVLMLQQHPDVLEKYRNLFRWVLVDEFQDTNTAQYTLAHLLSSSPDEQHTRNIFVVGDEDQSIYRWRGADYRNVRRFRKDYPDAQVVLLEQNYRSTQTVLDAAMGVISRNTDRTPKNLTTNRGEGEPIYLHEAYDEHEAARWVVDTIATAVLTEAYQPGDFAVLYRTNAQSRVVEEAFVQHGLPYRLVGATRYYARREVKDLIAFLKLVHNPDDSVSLFRILNVPPRRIGAKTADTLRAAAAQHGLSAGELLRDLGQHGPKSQYATHFKGRALGALADFGSMLDLWLRERTSRSVVQMIDLILDGTGYYPYLNDGTEEGEERWENVAELRNVANGYVDLGPFLEDVSLVSDIDNLEGGVNAPTLLTMHAAKGLEFRVVFILGLDEGTLPHYRSQDSAEELAEERRLLYVGLTRAKDQIFLVRTHRSRNYSSESPVNTPSRFLSDIPSHLLAGHTTPAYFDRQRSRAADHRRQTTWVTATSAPPRQKITPASYRAGQRVSHASFGEGVVIESRMMGNDEIVTVAFEGQGLKRLSTAIAKLTVLEG